MVLDDRRDSGFWYWPGPVYLSRGPVVKDSFRQSMAWLHTWTGLLMGWLLFAMFVTGTAAYFQEEITRWMKPELVGATNPVAATQGAMDHLQKVAPDAESW